MSNPFLFPPDVKCKGEREIWGFGAENRPDRKPLYTLFLISKNHFYCLLSVFLTIKWISSEALFFYMARLYYFIWFLYL